jgi:hypothetical protein
MHRQFWSAELIDGSWRAGIVFWKIPLRPKINHINGYRRQEYSVYIKGELCSFTVQMLIFFFERVHGMFWWLTSVIDWTLFESPARERYS